MGMKQRSAVSCPRLLEDAELMRMIGIYAAVFCAFVKLKLSLYGSDL
jgi:hypothetical protein